MTTSKEVGAAAANVTTGNRPLFGCTIGALDLIGFAFVVSHIGTIWAALSRLVH